MTMTNARMAAATMAARRGQRRRRAVPRPGTFPFAPGTRKVIPSPAWSSEPSAGRGGPAGLERFQRAHRPGQGAHLDQPHPGRHRTGGVLAVGRRRQEYRRALGPCSHHLLLDTPDGLDGAVRLDFPGPGDEPATGEVHRSQLVDDPQGEHEPGAGTADIANVDLHGEREDETLHYLDADHRIALELCGPDPDPPELAAPPDGQLHGRARPDPPQEGARVGAAADRLPVDRRDD